MRVLLYTVSYPPRRFIGSELMDHHLLKALQAAGHEVAVRTTDEASAWEYDGVPVFGRKRQPDADVVLCHGDFGRPAREHRSRHGVPLVVIGHNCDLRVKAGIHETRPALTIANSRHMVATLRLKSALVVNPPAPKPRRSTGNAITTLSLNELKGGEQFWRIAAAMPDRHFIAVKSGYGKQITPHRIPSNVQVVDHLPPDKLPTLWASTGTFLQLSASESWGMAAAEALAAGAHVIAHPTPGLRENLAHAATWADRDDTEAWVAAITEHHDREKSLRRARRNYTRSRQQLTAWVTAISRLENDAVTSLHRGSRNPRRGDHRTR